MFTPPRVYPVPQSAVRHTKIPGHHNTQSTASHLFLHSSELEVLAEVRRGIRAALGERAAQDA
jgi:hypothetical protein